MSSIVRKIVNSLNKGVLDELELSREIKHPGENGRAREQILSGFLRKIIPSKFSVDTGFVIDTVGGISNQIDIVIYRSDYHSVLEVGNIKHFMIESVVAVIENKASISDAKTLNQAFNNIKSVKSLDRSSRGRNIIVSPRGAYDKNNFQHQVFGAILTERSLSSKSLKNEFISFFEKTPDKNLWPNIYIDVRASSFRYVDSKEHVTVIPRNAVAFAISDPEAENYTPPLIELAYELISYLRIVPLIDFQPHEYFFGVSGRAKEYVSIPELYRG
ncbi:MULTISPECIES: DUF6602 domain-containing protein [unclassified Pseudomonas]|uniref:DUF6602 domain-containing protein n=1 Tax=unclassified Pseudomonas TaxID=196821 RepID=UPI000A726DD5|nr:MULTISPECIES: DUF6602 domain-containing protein [unclassified Pseudomonas]MDR8385496.1 hypothetical protein [Pseudomonas sp. JL2]